jgi:hypothetical protein
VGRRSLLDVWRIAPLCLMWSIWIELNARSFEDLEKIREEIKNILVKSPFSWAVAYNISQFSNVYEFVEFWSSSSI